MANPALRVLCLCVCVYFRPARFSFAFLQLATLRNGVENARRINTSLRRLVHGWSSPSAWTLTRVESASVVSARSLARRKKTNTKQRTPRECRSLTTTAGRSADDSFSLCTSLDDARSRRLLADWQRARATREYERLKSRLAAGKLRSACAAVVVAKRRAGEERTETDAMTIAVAGRRAPQQDCN